MHDNRFDRVLESTVVDSFYQQHPSCNPSSIIHQFHDLPLEKSAVSSVEYSLLLPRTLYKSKTWPFIKDSLFFILYILYIFIICYVRT